MREGGANYTMHLEQQPMNAAGGNLDIATVDLRVGDETSKDAAMLRLTSGEARSLARKLEVVADLLDLGDD